MTRHAVSPNDAGAAPAVAEAVPPDASRVDVSRRAAALVYDPASRRARGASNAPRLVAKGQGMIADEIIERARAAGVAIHESRELVAALMQLDLDREIPPALYVAVAEVLVWVYRLEKQGSRIESLGSSH